MSTKIPNVSTVVSYSYTVLNSAGKPIGTLQGFNPSANRPLERIREIMNEERDTVEIVPGRTDFSIAIDRFETYASNILTALGSEVGDDISKIVDDFTITEIVTSSKGFQRKIDYLNCMVQSWAKTITEGTVTVRESVTVIPRSIRVT